MILQTEHLRKFMAAASAIKANNLMPILGYIKFDTNTATKNALNSFIVYDMPGAEPMLIEEKVLFAFVNNTATDTITITQKNGRIYMKGNRPFDCPATTDEYPVIPETDNLPFLMPEDLLTAIGQASHFISEGDIEERRIFVFVGKRAVCGADGFTCYCKHMDYDVPEIVLIKPVAALWGKFQEAQFSENEKYQFLAVPGARYGFIKPVFFFQNLSPMFNIPDDAPRLELNKQRIIDFNKASIDSTPAELVRIGIRVGETVRLVFTDKDYEINGEEEIGTAPGIIEDFDYNAAFMNRMLKAIPDETLTFYKSTHRYYITGDSGVILMIMGIVNN